MRPHIKICCIQSEREARMAKEAGADALGLVSAMPSGPGPIAETLIAQIAATIPSPIWSVLLTSRRTAAEIIGQQKSTHVNTLQLVDAVAVKELQELRKHLPRVRLMQVIHVRGPESIDEAAACAPYVDFLLLDSGNPSLPIKELGGTGRTHDWSISRTIVERVSIPVFLAGGLNAANVVEAVEIVRPYGVDVCSGLRTNGLLDSSKLSAFVDAVRAMSDASQ